MDNETLHQILQMALKIMHTTRTTAPLAKKLEHIVEWNGDCVSWCPACGPACKHGDNSFECKLCEKKNEKI